jgi:hypothetical protein
MNSKQPDFYLAAMDTHRLDVPIKGWRVKIIRRNVQTTNPSETRNAAVRDEYLLIHIDPPFELSGQPVDKVLLSAKGEPISWSSIDRWPVFVYVLNPEVEDIKNRDQIGDDEFVVLDWAALFPNSEEASKFL